MSGYVILTNSANVSPDRAIKSTSMHMHRDVVSTLESHQQPTYSVNTTLSSTYSVVYVSIDRLKHVATAPAAARALMTTMHAVVRDTFANILYIKNANSLRVLSNLTGCVMLVPATIDLDLLSTVSDTLLLALASAGIHVHIGIAHGSVSFTENITGSSMVIGRPVTIAGHLASAKTNPGVLIHESYEKFVTPTLPTSHWLHSRNEKRLELTIPGKGGEVLRCFTLSQPHTLHYGPPPAITNNAPTAHALFIVSDLPLFSDGDVEQVIVRLNTFMEQVRVLLVEMNVAGRLSCTSTSDSVVAVLPDFDCSSVNTLAQRLTQLLVTEARQHTNVISTVPRLGLHRGDLSTFTDAGGVEQPAGSDLFVADELLRDDVVRAYFNNVIVSQSVLDALSYTELTEQYTEIAPRVMERQRGEDSLFLLKRFIPIDSQGNHPIVDVLYAPRTGWWSASDPTLSSILHARSNVVPYSATWLGMGVQTDFDTWCDDTTAPLLVRTYVAPGGSGKTRFALEQVKKRRECGWVAGFLPSPLSKAVLDTKQYITQSILIVVDYAESRTEITALLQMLNRSIPSTTERSWLAQALWVASQATGLKISARVRVVLLTRDPKLGTPLPHFHVPMDKRTFTPLPISQLPVTSQNSKVLTREEIEFINEIYEADGVIMANIVDLRHDVFTEAYKAFANALGKSSVTPPQLPPSYLAAPHFASVLLLHIAALSCVLSGGASLNSATSAFELVSRFVRDQEFNEEKLQSTMGTITEDIETAREQRRRVVAAITLLGGASEREVRSLLAAAGVATATIPTWERMLCTSYPTPAGSPYIVAPLEPDLFGEALVCDVLLEERTKGRRWLTGLLDGATDAQLRNALVVLGRAAAYMGEDMEGGLRHGMDSLLCRGVDAPVPTDRLLVAVNAAIALGAHVSHDALATAVEAQLRDPRRGSESTIRLALEVERVITIPSTSLAHIQLWAAQLLVSRAESDAQKARCLDNLGNALKQAGQRSRAVSVTHEGVALYRKLALQVPHLFEPKLARSLSNLGSMLSAVGQRSAAVVTSQEAVTIYRKLASLKPTNFELELAHSLCGLSFQFAEVGKNKAATVASIESVSLYRKLSSRPSDAIDSGLANSLTSLSLCFRNVRNFDVALALSKEAVALYRKLVARSPDKYEFPLARSLSHLVTHLVELKQHEAALSAAQEALVILRKLAKRNPEEYEPWLVKALTNLSNNQAQNNQHHDSLKASMEAVRICRKIVAQAPLAFENDLALALINMSISLTAIGRCDEAFTATQEAVTLYRRLAANLPDTFIPILAARLNDLANLYLVKGNLNDAANNYREAWRLQRKPEAANRRSVAGSLLDDVDVALKQGDDEKVNSLLQRLRNRKWCCNGCGDYFPSGEISYHCQTCRKTVLCTECYKYNSAENTGGKLHSSKHEFGQAAVVK